MQCQVEIDLAHHLAEMELLSNFDDAVEELQSEMADDFLMGKIKSAEIDEIFCDITTNDQFATALQNIFFCRNSGDIASLNQSITELHSHCKSIAEPFFEHAAVLQLTNSKQEI